MFNDDRFRPPEPRQVLRSVVEDSRASRHGPEDILNLGEQSVEIHELDCTTSVALLAGSRDFYAALMFSHQ